MLNIDYNFLERLVHRFALGFTFITKASFDFEETLCGSIEDYTDEKHLFISGLARSGTTVLMNNILDSGKYKSLTYLNMPFVLMPNGWKKLNVLTSRNFGKKERVHGDGILVGPDSPEAFEEVFWRVFCGHDYIFKDRLRLQTINNDNIDRFRKFVNHVLKSRENKEQSRYLSKNNNNVLRFTGLLKTFPSSFIIATFREPLQQAISLLNQHKKFSSIHNENNFTLRYMNWLGHFEFGQNHKPFYFGDDKSYFRLNSYSTYDINYWLLIWKNYYTYLINNLTPNVILFCFEKYCNNPYDILSNLFIMIDIDCQIKPVEKFNPKVLTANDIDYNILIECDLIYKQLIKKSVL